MTAVVVVRSYRRQTVVVSSYRRQTVVVGSQRQQAAPRSGERSYKTYESSLSSPYSLIFLCSVLRLIPSLAAALVCTPSHEAKTCAINSFST